MIIIPNGLLYNQKFVASFAKLMEYREFTPSLKMKLVKLKRQMIQVVKDMQEFRGDHEAMRSVLEEGTEYNFNKISLNDALSNHLAAEDIFNLESLLEEL